jgi:hypothetical protein
MLLDVFHKKTQAPVQFADRGVALDSAEIFESPFVYFTGQMAFTLTEAERQNMRRYLARGGVIFAEATCGRSSFDQAFRRELRQILPGRELEKLSADHLIYQFPNKINSVQPRLALARQLKVDGRIAPVLYGIELDGQLSVIYSPFDLSGGWALAQGPYNQGIEANDALAMGVNILSYVLTQ